MKKIYVMHLFPHRIQHKNFQVKKRRANRILLITIKMKMTNNWKWNNILLNELLFSFEKLMELKYLVDHDVWILYFWWCFWYCINRMLGYCINWLISSACLKYWKWQLHVLSRMSLLKVYVVTVVPSGASHKISKSLCIYVCMHVYISHFVCV